MKRSSVALLCVAFGLLTSPSLARAEESAQPSAPATDAVPRPAAATEGTEGSSPAVTPPDSEAPTTPSAALPPTPTTPSAYLYRSMSDEELAYEFERTSLGGPIAVTVIGGVISGLALPTFLFSGIGALVCHSGNVEGSPDCTPVDAIAVVSGVSTAVFGTMTIVGVVLLDQRSQKRTDIKNELWRRQAAGVSVKVGLAPTAGGSMLAIGGRF